MRKGLGIWSCRRSEPAQRAQRFCQPPTRRYARNWIWSGLSFRPGNIRCPLRQWEVAQLVGVTPSYVSQLLGELEREGVVRRERGWIWVEGERCL